MNNERKDRSAILRATRSYDTMVRHAAAEDPSLSKEELLEWVSRETDPYVTMGIKAHANFPRHLDAFSLNGSYKPHDFSTEELRESFVYFQKRFGNNTDSHGFSGVFSAIARNKNCDNKLLEDFFDLPSLKIIQDPQSTSFHWQDHIWEGMAKNPNITDSVVIRLLGIDKKLCEERSPITALLENDNITTTSWDNIFKSRVPHYTNISKLYKSGKLSANGVLNGVFCDKIHHKSYYAESMRTLITRLTKDDLAVLLKNGEPIMNRKLTSNGKEDLTLGDWLMENDQELYQKTLSFILEININNMANTEAHKEQQEIRITSRRM